MSKAMKEITWLPDVDERDYPAAESYPLLLLRDEPNGKVVIADGYHRLCAAYGFDEDALIPCKIV